MINYKKTYKESTSWRHWRLSCLNFLPQIYGGENKVFYLFFHTWSIVRWYINDISHLYTPPESYIIRWIATAIAFFLSIIIDHAKFMSVCMGIV